MRRSLGLLLPLVVLLPAGAEAQDVELLGERYGTAVPGEYRELRSRDPDAFRFRRGRALRAGRTFTGEGGDGAPLPEGIARTTLGPREGPVEGVFHVPVLLGLFGDSPAGQGPFPASAIETAYFGAGTETITAYYTEVSRGKLELRGTVEGWHRADAGRTRSWVTNGNSGLGFGGRVGIFIKDLLAEAEGIDWGLYDNDGPDGIPNSGDDDGFVDALAVIHPTRGGECGGPERDDRIWSHRWSLSSSTGSSWATLSPAAGGGTIRVDDYLIQPAFSCESGLNEIGVMTHELGHAFGLPDLYDTFEADGRHQGVGTWDLMATGSWGCDDRTPERPCHMGAWSKLQLGWVDVVEVAAGSGLTGIVLPPVASSGTVYRVESADGSGEYFLLENRQRAGFDASLHEEGLLIWQVDPDWVAGTWPRNNVNGGRHMGVRLRQADGLDELGTPGGGRGDARDPFPLVTVERENRVFHASSSPASRAFGGSATGVTLLDIRRSGEDVSFDLLNRTFSLTVRAEGGGPQGVFSVNGAPVSGPSHTFATAAFELHEIEAAGGVPVEPGVRRPFRSWLDDAAADRVRTVEAPMEDRILVARYEGEEVELAVEMQGGVDGVEPAELVSIPFSEELWFPRGTEVTLEARTRTGFRFLEWSGVLQGQPNPATVRVDAPLEAGAAFEVVYGALSASATLEAATEAELTLEVENGNLPITWTVLDGTVPRGLRFEPEGTIVGAPLETGSFVVGVEARDALGLTARAEVALDVREPALGLDALASSFLLTGPALTELQARFLDLEGNDNGVYDLGDLRAWILAHPELPMTAPARALVAPPTTLRLKTGGGDR